jgi:hypothetical protein
MPVDRGCELPLWQQIARRTATAGSKKLLYKSADEGNTQSASRIEPQQRRIKQALLGVGDYPDTAASS